ELSSVVALLQEAKAARFLAAVLDLSLFIREALTRHPRILDRIVAKTPEAALEDILAEISASAASADVTEASLMTSLRISKREAHVLIALCDLAGIFDTQATTGWLTDLAETCTGAAVRFLLLDADNGGKI